MDYRTILGPLNLQSEPGKRFMEIMKINDEQKRHREIALWACSCGFEELKFKPEPTKPQKVLDYYNGEAKTRKAMNNDPSSYRHFWNDSEVRKYFDDKEMVRNTNKNNLEWLKEIKGWLDPTRDFRQIEMIQNRIYDFETTVNNGDEVDWND